MLGYSTPAFNQPSPAPTYEQPQQQPSQDAGWGNAAQAESLGLGHTQAQGAGPESGVGAAPAPAPAGGRRTLRQGSQGSDVQECQRKLNLRRADLIEDGLFGPKTDAAVRSLQRAEGLAADGIVGPLTWAALDEGTGSQAPGEGPSTLGIGESPSSFGFLPAPGSHQSRPAGGPRNREQALDDADLFWTFALADIAEFDGYVSSGVLSREIAQALACMRDLAGDTQYTYELAKDALSDGSLLGMVFNSQRDALLQRRLAPTDPDRARFQALQATADGAVFDDNAAHTRGLILVGDGHSRDPRALIVDLCHELTHFRNRSSEEAIEADTSGDIADGAATLTAAQLAETRRIYVDEVCARHVEWWSAWTVRQKRLGGQVTDIDPPAPDALFTACIDLASNFSGDPIYDPFSYWGDLISRGDDSLDRQVAGWIALVRYQTLSGNPYRDMQSKAAFAAASQLTSSSAAPDGLGSDV